MTNTEERLKEYVSGNPKITGPISNSKYINHKRLGGTAACVIATNNHFGRNIHALWLELTGKKEPDDLSWELRVQIGIATEQLNAKFYSHLSNDTVSTFGDTPPFFEHKECDFLVAQLDGVIYREIPKVGYGPDLVSTTGVFEAKHSNHFAKIEDSRATYYPQLQHYMGVCDFDFAVLSVIMGNNQIKFLEVERDESYINELFEREIEFWEYVKKDIPPESESTSIRVPEKPVKTIDMSGSNEWGDSAGKWLETKEQADIHRKVDKKLKDMTAEDVRIAQGNGVKVVRDGRGRRVYKTEE